MRGSADTPEGRRRILFAAPCAVGLVFAALAFLASLTPSLIPRLAATQGLLGGLSLGAGYALGTALAGLWRFLELRRPQGARARQVRYTLMIAALLIVAYGLTQVTGWQNAARAALAMPPAESARPFSVAFISLAVALVLLAIGRIFMIAFDWGTRALALVLPPRAAVALALPVVAVLFYAIGQDVVMGQALKFADRTYSAIDARIRPDAPTPTDPISTGGPQSLVSWESLGSAGRDMVIEPPTADDIAALTGSPAKRPLRVFVGLNSAETPEARAKLALRELLRVDAFSRANLVIFTPTGTGWIDPAAQQPMEYLTGGDVATVAVQYSYLPSWMTLFLDRSYGEESANAVFREIYGYWHTLPREGRPRLYMFGLSLGSVLADNALGLYHVIGDPFDGALWAGPPFANRSWRDLAAARNPGSPIWLPEFGDGSLVRFANAGVPVRDPGQGWGPMRIVYLLNTSDPIVFFVENAWRRDPQFLKAPRAAEVSPDLRWIPGVTFLQLLIDMMTATTVPVGVGHVYAGADYADAWAAVLGRTDWPAARLQALKAALAAQGI